MHIYITLLVFSGTFVSTCINRICRVDEKMKDTETPAQYATTTLVVSWIFTFLGLMVFSLRFLNNWRFLHRFSWDFHWAAFTVVSRYALTLLQALLQSMLTSTKVIQLTAQIILQLAVNAGIGHNSSTLSKQDVIIGLKWATVFQVLAVASSVTGKFAIMAFLVQIRGIQDTRPWMSWLLGFLLVAINASDFGTMLGQCKPIQKSWDADVPGTCEPGDRINLNYSYFQASMFFFFFFFGSLYFGSCK